MKILLQRVSRASVTIAGETGETIGNIGAGLLLLVGFGRTDTGSDIPAMAVKVSHLRVFPDRQGRFSHSLLDIGGAVLAVPQFTLYADTRRGRRPDFVGAMPPAAAAGMFASFVRALIDAGIPRVESGRFGADMQVELVNEGPVTIMLGE